MLDFIDELTAASKPDFILQVGSTVLGISDDTSDIDVIVVSDCVRSPTVEHHSFHQRTLAIEYYGKHWYNTRWSFEGLSVARELNRLRTAIVLREREPGYFRRPTLAEARIAAGAVEKHKANLTCRIRSAKELHDAGHHLRGRIDNIMVAHSAVVLLLSISDVPIPYSKAKWLRLGAESSLSQEGVSRFDVLCADSNAEAAEKRLKALKQLAGEVERLHSASNSMRYVRHAGWQFEKHRLDADAVRLRNFRDARTPATVGASFAALLMASSLGMAYANLSDLPVVAGRCQPWIAELLLSAVLDADEIEEEAAMNAHNAALELFREIVDRIESTEG